jgi:hypothetical protein
MALKCNLRCINWYKSKFVMLNRVKLIKQVNLSLLQIYPKRLRFIVFNKKQINNNTILIKFIKQKLLRATKCTPNNNMEHRIINNIILKIQLAKLTVPMDNNR